MHLVTETGQLSVPLYHATSDFFAKVILETGLGARNIVRDWKMVDLARDIIALLANRGIGGNLDDEAHSQVLLLQRTCNQEITDGGFNFRHGVHT